MIATPTAKAKLAIERMLPADCETVFRCWTDPEGAAFTVLRAQ